MPRLSIKAIIIIAFSIALLVVAFFVLTTFSNMQLVINQSKNINKATNVQRLADKIHLDLEAEEIAADNFFYRPGDVFLAAYNKASETLIADTGNINQIGLYDTTSNASIAYLKSLIIKKKNLLNEAKRLYHISNKKNEAAYTALAKDKEIIESSRKLLDILEDKSRNVVTASGTYQQKTAQNTSSIFLVLAFIFFGLLTGLFFVINGGLTRRHQIIKQLSNQVSLINSVPDGIISTDDKFIINGWNRYAEEIYGFSAKEAIGKKTGTLIQLKLSDEAFNKSLAELNQKGTYKDEYTAVKKNGEPLFIQASVTALKTDRGEITGYVAVHRDISERKKSEQDLKYFNVELEKQVKAKTAQITNILDRITDGFLVLDRHLTFTFVNKKAGETLGYRPIDMVGKNIFTGFPESVSENFNQACLKSFKDQQHCFFENHYTPLDIWIENDIYPSPDGLSVFFKDVTFKKKTELALRESEAHYRHLIEHMHAGVVVHAADSSIVLSNHEALKLLGLTDINGKNAFAPEWNFVTSDGKKMQVDDYPVMRVIQSAKPLKNFVVGIDSSANKNRTWVLVNAFPEWDSFMKLKQVVVTFVDITDRKKIEEELKHREEILNRAQNIAKIGSWEFEVKTKSLTWSKEQYRIFEMEDYTGNLLFEDYRKKFDPADLEKLDTMMKRSLETGENFSIDHHIVCKNGTLKNILGIGEVVRDEQGNITGLKGTGQDITQIKKTEERLQKSYEEIRQLATHLQSIREDERTSMAREIHDELGQQLTGLNMYISWLNKKIHPQDGEIKEKFSSTIQLIEDTVKSVRRLSTKLRPSMLDDLGLTAAMEWQGIEFEKRSGIQTNMINLTRNMNVPAEIATGVFRIFQESLTNVARHAEAKNVTATLEIKNDMLTLTISDDGKGFILDEIGSKKTLGLFGMKERAMVMGGTYEINTSPGEGTIVSVSIPLNKYL